MLDLPVLSASGHVAHEWVYYVAYGKQLRRLYVIPNDPKTLAQHTQRAKFYVARLWWMELSQFEKDEWTDLAKTKRLRITGYNLFLRVHIKEVVEMIKQVIHGSAILVDGDNNVTIPEITPGKTLLVYNTYATGDYDPDKKQTGIFSAEFTSSTNILVIAKDTSASGLVKFVYQLVEYV